MNFIRRLAFKCKDNVLAIIIVRPVYRFFVSYKLKKKNKVFLQNANLLLRKMKEALDSNGILFWLEFGTLLGAYREHGFIKHDCDLDIGVFFKNDLWYKSISNGYITCYKLLNLKILISSSS